jgi:hypothetical protein
VAASTLAYTLTELRRWLAREIGKNRTWASVDTIGQTDIDDAIKAGLHQFYWAPNGHQWSFLQPTQAQLTIDGAYETGTVAVTTGTVTLTGGTWPSWAAQGDLWVDDNYYPVSSRTSNSIIVLHDSTLTGLSGETYSLKHREYDLPDDFGGLLDPFTYRRDQYVCSDLTKVNEAMIRSMETYPEIEGPPEYFCITSVAPVQTTSHQESKARAIFAPLPVADASYTVWYRYSVVPPALDGTTNVYAHGGAQYHETLLLSCLDKVSQMLFADDSKHAAFLESLAASTSYDRRMSRPQTHGFGAFSDGYDYDPSDRRRHRGVTTIDTSDL